MRGDGPETLMARASLSPRAWQRMLSGRRLDLLDPSPFDIEIADIAHGLARVARWNGQTKGSQIFSVAQHSLLVEAFVRHLVPVMSPVGLMAALLHDAPEYVVGDMISPFKAVIGNDYKAIEERILRAVHLRFGIPNPSSQAVRKQIKLADKASAAVEAVQLAGFEIAEAEKIFGRAPPLPGLAALVAPQSNEAAQAGFLKRFHALEQAMAWGEPATGPQ